MSRYVEFVLPDGSKIVIESGDAESEVRRAGGDRITQGAREFFEQSVENARKSAQLILDRMRDLKLHDSPNAVEITFGLKASGELGNMVIAKAGMEASYSIKLTWKSLEPHEDAN